MRLAGKCARSLSLIFLTHSISILSNEGGGRARRFSARVIILGRACRCSRQGRGQEAPAGEVSVGRQQRMQSWEEDMSGP